MLQDLASVPTLVGVRDAAGVRRIFAQMVVAEVHLGNTAYVAATASQYVADVNSTVTAMIAVQCALDVVGDLVVQTVTQLRTFKYVALMGEFILISIALTLRIR